MKRRTRKTEESRKPEDVSIQATQSGTDLWVYVALLIAIAAVYSQTRLHDFINYDDPLYVTGNAQVRNGLTWSGVVWAFTAAHDANWIPLTWISHMLDCQVFGLRAGLHHLMSVALHAAGSLLLFAAFRRMRLARWPSAFVAFVFGLHPLHVESVAWVAERKDVLCAVFFIGALYAYAVYVERPSPWRYAAVAGLFAAALMSKPMAVTFPFVVLLMDFWPLRRMGKPAALVREKIPLFALSLAASIITFLVQSGSGTVAALDQVPLHIRLENALVSYFVYLEQLIWPSGLAVVYPYAIPASWQWMGAGLLLSGVTVVVYKERARRPYLIVGWLWFVGMLVPVIGVVQVGLQSHADRYAYLPAIGVSIMLAWGAAEMKGALRVAGTFAGAIACVAWLAVTWMDLEYWQDTVSLFQRATRVTEGNYVAYNNLGVALRKQGRIEEAIQDFQMAEKFRPQDAELQDNLGEALLAGERIEEASPHFGAAIRLRPEFAKAHIDAGAALIRSGQARQAEEEYRKALRLDPGSPEANYGLGGVLAMEGRTGEARPHFEIALPHLKESVAMNPEDADGHYNLGILLSMMGRTAEALAQFSETARLAPGDVAAHFNLGVGLFDTGRLDEALEQFTIVIRLRPDDPSGHFNLGRTLVALGRSREAIPELTETLRLRPDFPDARRSLDAIEH